MKNRNLIEIFPYKIDETDWEVLYNNHLSTYISTKEKAIEYGKKMAQQNQPSKVIIYGEDGIMNEVINYGDDLLFKDKSKETKKEGVLQKNWKGILVIGIILIIGLIVYLTFRNNRKLSIYIKNTLVEGGMKVE